MQPHARRGRPEAEPGEPISGGLELRPDSANRRLKTERASGKMPFPGQTVTQGHGQGNETNRMAGEPKQHRHEHLHGELEDLRKELESFQQEKERVRAIVGKIGGVPKTQAKILNVVFFVVIVISLVVSVIGGEQWRLLMIETATVALSVKIIYLIHSQMKVAHFEFWILSSLEWRINEIMKQLRELQQDREAD